MINATRDNLYKWYVISGLVIGLFALSTPYRFVDGLSRRATPLETATRRSEIEANDLFQKTEQLSKTLAAEGQPDAEGKTVNTMSDDDKKAAVKTLDESHLKLNIKYAEIKAANSELAHLHQLTVAITVIGGVLFLIGAFLFVSGLRKWREKVQVVQDLALQNELDKLAQDKTGKK